MSKNDNETKEDNVIDFVEAKKHITLKIQSRDRFIYNRGRVSRIGFSDKCYCNSFIIDKNSYTVECEDCGKIYNPIAILEDYAEREKMFKDLYFNLITECEKIYEKLELNKDDYIKSIRNDEKRKWLCEMHSDLKCMLRYVDEISKDNIQN